VACSALDAAYFHDQFAAFDYVERLVWPNRPVCPHCRASFDRVGILKGMRTEASRKNPQGLERYGLYKCYACGKTFTVRAGTIFEHSHLALHLWLQVIHIMVGGKKVIRTRQIQHMLNCSMKTAWFLTYRLREFMKAREPASVGGTRPRPGLRAGRASHAPLNRRAASKRTKQARRFKELAKDVGADELPEGFADAVHKLATAGPVCRKPLNARPRSPVHLMERV
jgi:transposase-like protein